MGRELIKQTIINAGKRKLSFYEKETAMVRDQRKSKKVVFGKIN